MEKSRSSSGRMATKEAFKVLGLQPTASIEEINKCFKAKLAELEKKYPDKPDKLVQEADHLYSAYRSAYLSKDGATEEGLLPVQITGPDSMLNAFGIAEIPHTNLKVQMQSSSHYRDGELVKKAFSKTESFINKDGKREVRVYENGKLIKHTIGDKDMLK